MLGGAALIGIAFSSTASAAGGYSGYGGISPHLSGNFVSILAAKEIGPSGGTLSVPVHHGWLTVYIPPGSVSAQVQGIVVLDHHPSSFTGRHGDPLLDFSFLEERSGNPVRTAGSITFTFSGPQVSSDCQVGVMSGGKVRPIVTSVSGDSTSFTARGSNAYLIFSH